MNLTITAILVLLLSFNTLAEELPLELQAPETAPVKKMSVPSETLMKLMEERQQDLDRREAAVRREEERLKLLRSDIEGLLKKQAGPAKSAAVSPSGGKPTGVPTHAANLVHLSQAFETMPVEEAAQRIEKMREAVALDLLARLKSKTTGQILAALDPAKAARLVEKLAADPGTSSSEVSLKRK